MEAESGKVIADMSGDNRRQIVLKGGRGGKGNQHYATRYHAGSEVCTARTACTGAGSSSGTEGDRRRRTGRISLMWVNLRSFPVSPMHSQRLPIIILQPESESWCCRY